jgi:hypothetical protein
MLKFGQVGLGLDWFSKFVYLKAFFPVFIKYKTKTIQLFSLFSVRISSRVSHEIQDHLHEVFSLMKRTTKVEKARSFHENQSCFKKKEKKIFLEMTHFFFTQEENKLFRTIKVEKARSFNKKIIILYFLNYLLFFLFKVKRTFL